MTLVALLHSAICAVAGFIAAVTHLLAEIRQALRSGGDEAASHRALILRGPAGGYPGGGR